MDVPASTPLTGIRALVGQRMSKNTKFMGADIKINKLSVEQVLVIQAASKEAEEKKDEADGFELIKLVIRSSVDGASELSDDAFQGFPLDELTELSNAILKYSGLGQKQGN